ncbi:peptidase domain-containing ABC transporter [Dysgonomonas massiliensis]|uniref:peptidase domain-containing ABC transporter n=1 Tax=Dysgonomonas massiliensis TaxID=2040292 RepID=UPI001607AFE2|nr:peptidase domain-containing ABC transporter [Dysgonomonas massiliensis]
MHMRKFPNYTQLDEMDCGPVCLKIISKYYGRDYSIQYLRDRSFLTREGVSMLGIADAAKDIGFSTQGVHINFSQLANHVKLPCIIHWNQEHFVVCYSIIKKKRNRTFVKISDPLGEKYILEKSKFLECWIGKHWKNESKGAALLLEPTPNFYTNKIPKKSKGVALSGIFKYIRSYKPQLILLVITLLIGGLFSFMLPFLTQAVVDRGIGNRDLNLITLILIAQLVVFATQLTFEFIRNRITLKVNSYVSISLISDFLQKLIKLPLRFFDTKNIGDIMQRIEDNDRVKSFLTGSTLMTLYSIVTFIVFSVILAYYNFTILVIFIVGNLLYILWILLFVRYRRKLDIIRFAQAASERSSLIQIVSGMQEIKLNNCESQQLQKWKKIQLKLFDINIKSLTLGQYQQLGSVFFSHTTSLIITFISARSVIEGSMTLGMMMAISYIIGLLSGPIAQAINFIQSAQDANISLERLDEIHSKEDEEQLSLNKISKMPTVNSIQLNNLYFSYDGAHRNYALQAINIEIPKNKVTAIVGASGSGKTTLVKLLLGFYKPLNGIIRVGNVSLDDISPRLWRSRIGAVMQDGYIFSDTIANNIAIGVEDVDPEKLSKAIDVANIRDFIESLPLKLNTKIGFDGNGVSLGQRQRILIARAVYKNPDYLFFDEATNALDANNEKVIMNNLNRFYVGKTVVVVAHRLSTVQNADKIIVLENGTVIEEGNHDILIRKRGAYFQLVRNQLELGC